METISPLVRSVAWVPIIAMVVFMASSVAILVGVGLYIAAQAIGQAIANKVDDARFRFRVRRIKRQMERAK